MSEEPLGGNVARETNYRVYNTPFSDGARWERFDHRPGDIIIATPSKCGTTWTQTIVASLLFPDGDCPGPVVVVSPWMDGRIEPIEPVAKRLDRQEHRRFVKTHTPADGVPFWPTASYIVVVRDGRDAFMSLDNHMKKIHQDVIDRINAEAGETGNAPLAWTGDVATDLASWLSAPDANSVSYLASWWPRRDEPNVLFVHYNDLKADLDGEMRRIASFLGIDIAVEQWPAVVQRCTFEAMKARPEEIGPFEYVFKGGTDSFLFKGTNGRWRDVLGPRELDLYARTVAERLTPEAATWLEQGSIASGARP
jgi:aryl sulfotransferase